MGKKNELESENGEVSVQKKPCPFCKTTGKIRSGYEGAWIVKPCKICCGSGYIQG